MKSLGKFPDPFIAEISGQPDALRRAAAGSREDEATLRSIAEVARGRHVVFTGMGSSYDACYPAVTELAQAGIVATMLDAAELLHFRTAILERDALLVAVSQSGESVEVVRVVGLAKTWAAPPVVVAVTNGTENSLARAADHVIDTRAGVETGPSTMTFAGSLVSLAALGRVLSGAPAVTVIDRLMQESELAAVATERVLAEAALADELADWFGAPETAVILGRGPARAAAEMGALTVKEAVGIPIESLQTAQFRHGPLELVGPGLAAIVIATESETIEIDLGLADELVRAGSRVLLVTTGERTIPGARTVATGPLDRALCPAVAIVPIQLLAWRLAGRRGREPGAYYRATKVTTHE
jgi:glucosamine--fructose-6-phosphate aminotransferase (isomerizing)